MACLSGLTTIGAVDTLAELRGLGPPTANEPGCYHVRGHTTAGDRGGGPFYWCVDSVDLDDDGLVVRPVSAPAVGRWKRMLSGPLHVSWWGVRGDGSDESVALQRAFDAAAGRVLVFGEGRTYGFVQTGDAAGLVIHPDTMLINHGATLKLLERECGGACDSDASWEIGESAILAQDGFRTNLIRIDAASRNVRKLFQIGSGAGIGSVEISSAQQQLQLPATSVGGTQKGSRLDGALQVRGAGTNIGCVRVSNFDLPMVVYEADHVLVEHVELTSYKRGVLVELSDSFHLLSGVIETLSPYAIHAPDGSAPDGYNALLLAHSNDVFISGLRANDAFGHAIRIGGDYSVERYAFSNLRVSKAGNSGLKIASADGTEARYVQISGLDVCDAACRTPVPETNQEGLRLEKCSHVTVTGFQLSKNERPHSAFTGIFVKGAEFVTVDAPAVVDTYDNAIHLLEGGGRPVNSVFLHEPRVMFTGGHALRISSPSQILRDVTFFKGYVRNYGTITTGAAIHVEAAAGVLQPVILQGWVRPSAFPIFVTYESDADIRNALVSV
jgi:hypothetical protein